MTKLSHKFVEFIPEKLEERVLYVSMTYGTVSHKCACGCGLEVVTPLTPTDWKLTFDGETISLHPSIGNWNYPCRSHYWIRNSRVQWAGDWSKEEVSTAIENERVEKDAHYGQLEAVHPQAVIKDETPVKRGFWSWLLKRFRRQ